MAYKILDTLLKYEMANDVDNLIKMKEEFTGKKDSYDLFNNTDDVFEWIENPYFGREEYRGKFSGYTEFIAQSQRVMDASGFGTGKFSVISNYVAKRLVADYGYTLGEVDALRYKKCIDMQDIITFSNVRKLWLRNKQVYVMDNDFSEALLRTKGNIRIPSDIINRLDTCTFVLDTSENTCFVERTDFMLIHIRKNSRTGLLHLYNVKIKGDFYWVFHTMMLEEEKETNGMKFFTVPKDMTPDYDPVIGGHDPIGAHETEGLNNTGRKLTDFLIMQLVLYLAAGNRDVEQSSVTKQTYRAPKGNIIKNKFSEVRIWETGFNVGRRIREFSSEENQKESGVTRKGHGGSGTPKRPHYREHHFHHYWVGPRDDESKRRLELRWLEGTFVNAKDDSDIPVKITRIKRKE